MQRLYDGAAVKPVKGKKTKKNAAVVTAESLKRVAKTYAHEFRVEKEKRARAFLSMKGGAGHAGKAEGPGRRLGRLLSTDSLF